jgi:hypothetical protein
MAFNSAALSAGIGSMLQGIQQNAQSKLQLAQMERQQRIEEENIKHQRAMEDLARRGGALNLDTQTQAAPYTIRQLKTGVELAEGLKPFQLRGAEQGVIGQEIGNRDAMFKVDRLNPLMEEQQKAAAKLATGTVDTNISLAKQATQSNTFGARNNVQGEVDAAIESIKRAKALLSNKNIDYKTQQEAFKEYQAAQQALSKFPNRFSIMSNPDFADLFGDTKQMRASVIQALGGTPENIADPNFDISGLINTFAPSMAPPTIGQSPEIQNYISNLIGGTMGQLVQSPDARFINRKGLQFDANGQLVGNYVPSSVDAGALAKFSYPSFVARVKATAPAMGTTPKDVFTSMGFTPDMLGIDGLPKIEDKNIADKTYRIMKGYYTPPQGINDIIRKYEQDNLAALAEQVKTRIAKMNERVGVKQSEAALTATLKQLEYPMIQNYQNAYSTALNRLDRINKGLETIGVMPKDLVVIATAWPKIKATLSVEQQKLGETLIAQRKFVADAITKSNDQFIDKKSPSEIRASNAIRILVEAGLTDPVTTGGGAMGGATGGIGAGAGAAGFGVSPNLKFDTPSFNVLGGAPPKN